MVQKETIGIRRGERQFVAELCSSLVAIPTPHPPGEGYETLIHFLSRWFGAEGIPYEVISVPEAELPSLLPPEGRGPRFFFQACLEGREPGPTLYFQGHYDTVPPTPDWTRLPFQGEVDEERVWGLGASDMKGGLASMMAAMQALSRAGGPRKGKVVFLATPDEEYASGANIRYLFSQGRIRGDFAVVGEFSGLANLFVGMKGGTWGDLRVRGRAAHGSQPQKGINAFEKLSKVMGAIEGRFKPRLGLQRSAYRFLPPDCPYPTLMVGGIVRGTNAARSVVPDRAEASFDLRTIPEDREHRSVEELRGFLISLQEEDPDLMIEMEVASRFPTYAVPEDARLVRVFRRAVIEVTGQPPALSVSCAATEAAFFVQHGIPAVAYGPGLWERCHAPDEHVRIDDLVTTSAVYGRVADLLLSGGEG